MAAYDCIIFDADHTILDFDADERRAFTAGLSAAGMEPTEETVEAWWRFSAQNWVSLGLHNVHLPRVRADYHALYRTHVRVIFDRIAQTYRLGAALRQTAERVFLEELSRASCPVEDAPRVIRALAARYRLCVATNGLCAMQPGRLAPFADRFERIFISEEIGAVKPDPAFFRAMTAELGVSARRCLMVGDSLASDVAGANAVGMDCIWFNRRGEPLPSGYRVRAEIARLADLLPLLAP